MPVHIESLENGRVLYFVFESPLTLEEIKDAMRRDGEYRDSVSYKVHALVHLKNINIPPNSLSARSSPSLVHPRSGYFVVVGASGLNRAVTGAILKMIQNKKIRFVDTPEAGVSFLRKIITTEEPSGDAG